jgi:hypothetical protein
MTHRSLRTRLERRPQIEVVGGEAGVEGEAEGEVDSEVDVAVVGEEAFKLIVAVGRNLKGRVVSWEILGGGGRLRNHCYVEFA